MSIFKEAKRRHVFRAVVAYAIAGWVIVEGADVLFPGLGIPDSGIRIVTWSYVLGFLPAAIVAWFFQWTPKGMKREFGLARRVAPDHSIVVLPFVNMSDDPSAEYFSDGLAEELLTLLTKIPELKVISHSSAFAFKGQNLSTSEVAQRLHVANVLEGSVRKAGKTLRVSAQLVRAKDSSTLWSETWNRTLDDIFVIQDEIAASVVARLKIKMLGKTPATRAINPDAYELYLQARYRDRQGTRESIDAAVSLYEQAIAIQPEFPEAWADLARCFGHDRRNVPMSPSEALQKARAAAEKAIEIDPHYGPAYARLAWIVMYLDRDFPAAARLIDRALKLAPRDPVALGVAGNIAANIGRIEDAIQFIEFVVSRDPVNATVLYNLGLHYLNAGQFDQAISTFNKVRNISPDRTGLNIAVGLALLLKNRPQQALENIRQEPDDMYRNLGLAMTGSALGDATLGDTALDELIKHHAVDGSYFIAMAHAYRGDNDRAFRWLEAEYARNGGGALAEINADIVFKPLQTDPRWRPFLDKIGMSPGQLSAIGFNARPPQQHQLTPESNGN